MKNLALGVLLGVLVATGMAFATTTSVVTVLKVITCSATNYAISAIAQTGVSTCTGPFARLDITDQSATGGANYTVVANSTGNLTVDCGLGLIQKITNGGAWTLTAPTSDGACILDMENNGTAGALTLSGFSPNTMGGATLDTTNGHNFRLYISRADGHSTVDAKALQ